MMFGYKLYTILLILSQYQCRTEQEHKVHNIILYPEKHSWCRTTPIRQIIAMPGYESLTIDNNICVGACYSYSIPKTEPAEPGELIGPYCDSCQPIETKCYHVTLTPDQPLSTTSKSITSTPSGDRDDNHQNLTDLKQKRVQIITRCSCITCNHITDIDPCTVINQTTIELPANLYATPIHTDSTNRTADQPDLLGIPSNHIPTSTNQHLNYKLDEHLKSLIHRLQTSDDINHNDIIELINQIGGDDDDNKIIDFVNFVNQQQNDDDLVLDIGRFRDLLDAYVTHRRHHLGEQLNFGGINGRLMAGPHGSMVLGPKFVLDSDTMKPNRDGVVISYQTHQMVQDDVDGNNSN